MRCENLIKSISRLLQLGGSMVPTRLESLSTGEVVSEQWLVHSIASLSSLCTATHALIVRLLRLHNLGLYRFLKVLCVLLMVFCQIAAKDHVWGMYRAYFFYEEIDKQKILLLVAKHKYFVKSKFSRIKPTIPDISDRFDNENFDILQQIILPITEENKKYKKYNGGYLIPFDEDRYLVGESKTLMELKHNNIKLMENELDNAACQVYKLCKGTRFLGRIGSKVIYSEHSKAREFKIIDAETGALFRRDYFPERVAEVYGAIVHPEKADKVLIFTRREATFWSPKRWHWPTLELYVGNINSPSSFETFLNMEKKYKKEKRPYWKLMATPSDSETKQRNKKTK